MFGNQLGWIISAIIAAAGIFAGFQLLLAAQPTSPTGWVQQTVLPLQAGESAKTILDPMTDLKDDAGDLYRDAISDYERHKTAYQNLQTTKDFDEAAIAELKGLDDLVQAAGCPAMDLFKSKPDDVVGFATSVPALDDLDEIAKSVGSVIALAKYEKRYDVASKYANALAALGYHLYMERVAYIELSAGENYLGTGLAAILEIAQAEKMDAKISAEQAVNATRLEESDKKIQPVIRVISGQGQQDIGEHGAFVKIEQLVPLAEYRDTQNIRGQEVGRKLHALEFRRDGTGKRLGQSSLAGARIIFEQHMAAGSQGREQLPDRIRLAVDDAGDVVRDVVVGNAGGGQIRRRSV